MKCKYVQQHLLDYSESQLDQKTYAMIEAHLRNCPACAQELKDFEQTVRLLQATPLETPPERFWDDFTSGVMRKVRRMETPSRQIGRSFFPNMKMATVALATLVLVLGLALLYTSGDLEKRAPSLFQWSTPTLTKGPEQPGEQSETMLDALIPEELIDEIVDSDFALLGGENLSSLPTDANDATLYLLIESLDGGEKALLLSELEKMRKESGTP